ncbi:putative toxin-antitoxin system toxin component, PIN family [Candidatus Kaiserbacteria bacterium RIFCSPHIGHO2_02_FULL_59_21]|uniref:PIN domain-containing protein n=2 Tax=Candidatus Kaiseribacteriota TaxID=1752734 RepID=A0A0G1YS16_9BACT|nr:MAG: hypothetical protein UY98_C0031G0009 [Candidatus Kaiserbacteria bacterium GW2011_GWA2_58_9]OGG62526.1 MAG: putative toxin-antitoxin system toxin component, PIN family [Candidatus Kaiserbacteria bacterium RIFCSPHIGHO2_01_FULL_58_22]OGG67497.1 MAG: putative toxin-antitoxin system toxin component, PIN family [Candidatus Kaiserbacteria bacterium RIFCSPHIGHO2_02_FULL_59_21]OGG80600.1 MAG: putative toxin-antitoxin system toxin component, PIN family [Candidatus Kaiserbacteria bacterium RIFCSPLO
MRVILDTNVLISAFLWRGAPAEIFFLAKEGKLAICVNKEILQEFESVLAYSKFASRLQKIRRTPSHIIDEFVEIAESYPSIGFPRPQVVSDPSDDIFLACALVAGAEFIISGDRHLLKLKTFSDIPIIQPAQFLKRMRRRR